jgi:hypothetical protein
LFAFAVGFSVRLIQMKRGSRKPFVPTLPFDDDDESAAPDSGDDAPSAVRPHLSATGAAAAAEEEDDYLSMPIPMAPPTDKELEEQYVHTGPCTAWHRLFTRVVRVTGALGVSSGCSTSGKRLTPLRRL